MQPNFIFLSYGRVLQWRKKKGAALDKLSRRALHREVEDGDGGGGGGGGIYFGEGSKETAGLSKAEWHTQKTTKRLCELDSRDINAPETPDSCAWFIRASLEG